MYIFLCLVHVKMWQGSRQFLTPVIVFRIIILDKTVVRDIILCFCIVQGLLTFLVIRTNCALCVILLCIIVNVPLLQSKTAIHKTNTESMNLGLWNDSRTLFYYHCFTMLIMLVRHLHLHPVNVPIHTKIKNKFMLT